MRFRANKKRCMMYPEDPFNDTWNVFITCVLLFTSLVTPFRIAFYPEDNMNWKIINFVIDFMFLIDIILIFNTAFYIDDFSIIEDRCLIA